MKSGNRALEEIYKSRINKALDYIENHLESNFTLEELAAEANFSKFHFNRLFKAFIGETPFQFITRIRLEKAANLLLTDSRRSIADIAFQCGYCDPVVFSRNFRLFFGTSASRYRTDKSNISQEERKRRQSQISTSSYFCRESQTMKWRTTMKTNKSAEVKELPAMTVAYIRHIGPYKGDAALFDTLWGKLCNWAGPRQLLAQPNLKFLTIYHDDPNITSEDKLRMSVCITVPPDTKVDGEFGKMELEKGSYLVARFDLDASGFTEAWDWVYGQWFPASGYQPDDRPCFEIYPEEPKDGRFIVDICVPVKPL